MALRLSVNPGVKMTNETPKFLTPAQVVARWNKAVTTGTLANWRSKSEGPAFQKFGSRVRYPLTAVEAYEAANAVGVADNDNNERTQGAA